MYEPKFLERFFRNLLFGEQWVLKNRYLVINPPAEYAEQPRLDTPTSTEQVDRTSTEQAPNKLMGSNTNVNILVGLLGDKQLSIKEMMERLQLKHRPNFLDLYLTPAITEGYIRMLYPDSPRHPRQRYLLTVKGTMVYSQMQKLQEDKR